MLRPPSARPSAPAFTLGCLLALTACAAAAAPREARSAPPTSAEVADKKGDLKELRGQIESLRKEMAATEDKRASAADQLQGVEREISQTQRELHDLGVQRGRLQSTLRDLGAEARELEARLADQQQQLAKLVYRQYLQGNPDALRLLLNGDDPNQTARDLHYLAAIGRARGQLLRQIEATMQRKQALAAVTRERADDLARVEARQKEEHGRLLAQREQRRTTLGRIAEKIAQQRREIGALQRDEKRLSQLIDRLTRLLAARPAPRPTPRPPQAAEGKAPARAEPEMRNEVTPTASSAEIARLKGSLRLPTRGSVSNRFGAPRQEGSTWKGLFIRAPAGAEVKAIAAGRVVFADWLRGFGNLLIIDHGGGYLSVYGNNDALLKQVGDPVRGGDDIAAVGNSGGNPESGLYFELRHQGQALDPLKWVTLK